MYISYNWLKQHLDIDQPAHKTADLLTDLGLEVEGISTYDSIKGGLRGVVVGHVIACDKHPNADRLSLTKVDIGKGETVQIVCGAPNISKGQKVAVATVGTTLYDDKGNPLVIKKSKIRGEESFGMICAEDELGLGRACDGIMVLSDDLEAGTPLKEAFNVVSDEVFEIGLTPNRSDAMGHFGVARDLYTGLVRRGNATRLKNIKSEPNTDVFKGKNIAITVENPNLAPRYCGVTLDVKIKPSPKELQHALKAIGITPKNNIVDITNYVMHDLGQPLHAFDAGKIKGDQIVVKTVSEGTGFVTLDGKKHILSDSDLMICDTQKPLCIAGVLGGANSGITDATTSIFLESAYFDPVSVRKTAKSHGLHTDASFRFERGIDPNMVVVALRSAVEMLIETADAKVTSEITDLYPHPFEPFKVLLSLEKIKKLIGADIPKGDIIGILDNLEINVLKDNKNVLTLSVPPYRSDVRRDVDVIEDILRIYGYNNVKACNRFTIPAMVSASAIPPYKVEDIVTQQLLGQGFHEIMTSGLTSGKHLKNSGILNPKNNVEILNPLSSDLGVMRQSVIFSGLEVVAHNCNRQERDLRLFEFGKTYHKAENSYEECKHLSIFITGNLHEKSWVSAPKPAGFFYLKGVVMGILSRLGIENIQIMEIGDDVFSEGISFFSNREKLLDIGVISKKTLEDFEIDQEVLCADFNWSSVLKYSKLGDIKVTDIPKFPVINRDLALLVDREIKFSDILDISYRTEKKLLKCVDLFDVYKGENLPEGKESYGVRFMFQNPQKTLTDSEVDKTMDRLRFAFEKQLGVTLR